jgi:hypothetical protein
MPRTRIAGLAVLTVLFPLGTAWAASSAACAPPAGFHDTPHPAIAPAEQLVSHTEEVVIDRPLPVVVKAMNKPLNDTIRQSSKLPGVSGDFMLTPGSFGAPGSRHLVCLTDGGSTEEESLEQSLSASLGHFRYIVWKYTTPKARPIAYGVGEFNTRPIDATHTRITWTYSFQLKEDVFPGFLGALGRYLFRIAFLDRDYAAMMRGVLAGYKSGAEQMP